MNILRTILLVALVFLLSGVEGWAQRPDKQVNQVGFRKEMYGGIQLNTNGWGGNFTYAKFKTSDVKRLYSVDFSFIKSPKEYRILSPGGEDRKSFIFGKLNSFYTVQLGFGSRKQMFDKLRQKGVSISRVLAVGPSIGILKPVYLQIFVRDGSDIIGIQEARYDPEQHFIQDIYGRAPNSRGLFASKIVPGIFAKVGLRVEFSRDRERIRAIEVGLKAEGYPEKVQIMNNDFNRFYFTELYLSFALGKKSI